MIEELPKESGGCAPIPSRLHEDVDDVAVLVHGAPQILWSTSNRYEQLVQMPLLQITGASGITTEQGLPA
jgi:hypothetical protein